ncbi:MAG TPA: serine/threonine protein kinase, partial [Actinotalea sp.]
PPFGARPLASVLARARSGAADLDGLDARTTAVLRSALQVDPWRRATPEEVVAELRRAADGDTEPDEGETVLLTGAATAFLATDGRTRSLPVDASGTHAFGTDAVGTDAVGTQAFSGAAFGGDALADGDQGEDDQDDDLDGDGYDAAYDADGYDEDGDDPDEDDDADRYGTDADGADEAELSALPEPRRRVGTVLAAGILLTALGTTRPGVALAIAALLAVLMRTVGLAALAVQTRRRQRGRGGADVARALVASPWYLVRAVLGVLPAVLVGASVVLIVGSVVWWLVASGKWVVAAPGPGEFAGALPGNASWVDRVLVGALALLGLLMIWFGPMSRTTRLGGRWVARAVAPGWAGATTAVVLLLGVAALVLVLLHGEPTVWWPLTGEPALH